MRIHNTAWRTCMFLSTCDWWMSMPPCSCLPGTDECPSPHVPVYLWLMNVHAPMFLSTWDWWMSKPPCSCLPETDECPCPHVPRLSGTDECPCLHVPVYLGLMNVHAPMFLCSSWDQTKCFARGNFFNSSCSLPQGKGQRLSKQDKNSSVK